MGQPITVVEKKSHRPGVLRFEINRPLTGMGHERYLVGEPVEGHRPVDECARRLLAHGGIDAVHIYDNMITVDLSKGASGDGLLDVIRELFLFYPAAEAAPVAAESEPMTEPEPAAEPVPEPTPTT
jgi:hypothetical protein